MSTKTYAAVLVCVGVVLFVFGVATSCLGIAADANSIDGRTIAVVLLCGGTHLVTGVVVAAAGLGITLNEMSTHAEAK